MSRRLEPKCKQCRREGEKLFLKSDKCSSVHCPIVRRNFRPGVHGPLSRSRPTPFGLQLREKQKAKEVYGVQERQFHNYFFKAKKKIGNTANFLVQLLEMRLDNVVFRLGIGRSRSLARQLVSHGHIRVNGRKVNIPSFQTKAGQVITLGERAKKSKLAEGVAARLAKYQPPSWLSLDPAEPSGKILNAPQGDDLKQNFDPTRIVEFYSR